MTWLLPLLLVLNYGTIYLMGKKHSNTFNEIQTRPDRSDIDWEDFLGLLVYLGAEVKRQSGSAFGVRLNGVYAVFHKPHPGHVIYRSDLKRILNFLKNARIEKVE